MAGRFLQFFDFSQRENRIAILLAFYYMLAMASVLILKPARNALLLDGLGTDYLIYGIILTAIVTGVVVWVGDFMSRFYSGSGPVLTTTLLMLVSLLFFRQLFETSGPWIYLPFYVFVQLFSVVILTQFRIIAGNQFTPREGKRLWGVVGVGATTGGILGSAIVFRVVDRIGTENLLYVSAAILVLMIPMVMKLEGSKRKSDDDVQETEPEKEVDQASAWQLLKEYRHIRLIALILGASMIASTILDVQYNDIVNEAFETKEEKTSFFAMFNAGQNVAAILVQLVATRWLLLRFGVGAALILLPFALASGAIGFLIYPTLLVAGIVKFSDGTIRYSLQEATTEVLYLPLPSRVRARVRPMIDMFGMRLFDGLAGLLILFCTTVILLPLHMLSVISLVILGGWFFAVFVIKREYLDTLRGLFSGVSAESQDRASEVLDDSTVDLLLEQLESPDELSALQSLAMLDLRHDKSSVYEHLGTAVREHPSEIVRAEALNMLNQSDESGYAHEAAAMLDSAVGDVRLSAVRYLCQFGRPGVGTKLNELLNDDDQRVRIAAIGSLAQDKAAEKQSIRESLVQLCANGEEVDDDGLAEAALLLGTIDDPENDDLLVKLLRSDSPLVIRNAVESASRTTRRLFAPLIVLHLGDESVTLYAQRALKQYGDVIVHMLRDYIDDPHESEQVRRAIPGCYAAIGTQKAMDVLLAMLGDHQSDFGSEIAEALGELHARYPDYQVDTEPVEAALLAEISQGVPDDLEVRDAHLRHLMSLLALIYPADDVFRAYAGMTGGEKDVASNAVELIDNLLRADHKRTLLPFIEACVR
jgi:ATP:ADP antiporter, AAA family